MIDRYKRLSDWLYYFLALPCSALLPAPWGYASARWHGRHFFKVHPGTRERAVQNYLRVFPEAGTEEARQVVRKSFQLMASDDMEGYYFPYWNPRNLARYFRFAGLEHLDEAVQARRGVILVSGHFGAVNSAMIALGKTGYSHHPLGHDSANDPRVPAPIRAFTRWRFRNMNPGAGIHYLFFVLGVRSPQLTRVTLEAYRLLRAGEILLTLLDITPNLVDNKQEVLFLGRSCQFPTGPVRLAHMAGAPLLPFFVIRDEKEWWRQTVVFQSPIPQTGDLKTDMQLCADRLDEMVRQYPSHWFAWDSLTAFETSASACPTPDLSSAMEIHNK